MKYGYIAVGTVNKGTFETYNGRIYGDFVFGENKESVENIINQISRNSDNGKTCWHVTRREVEKHLGKGFVAVTFGQRAGYCMSADSYSSYSQYEMEHENCSVENCVHQDAMCPKEDVWTPEAQSENSAW